MSTSTTPEAPNPGDEYDIGQSFNLMELDLGFKKALEGVLIDVIRRIFATPDVIENPRLRGLTWLPTDHTNILIESVFNWKPNVTDLRPAILVRTNRFAGNKRAIGHRQQRMDNVGNPHFTKLWAGSYTMFCIDQDDIRVEHIASLVRRHLDAFQTVFQLNIRRLKQFDVLEDGQCGILEASDQHKIVPISLSVVYDESWVLEARVPRLKGIVVDRDCSA